MNIRLLACVSISLFMPLSGCVTFDAAMLEALAKDPASFCGVVQGSGGGGAAVPAGGVLPVPVGGYGQGSMTIARSGKDHAKVEVKSDGSCVITNGNP